eukprot:9878256-Karenia_brevis.AAC.1
MSKKAAQWSETVDALQQANKRMIDELAMKDLRIESMLKNCEVHEDEMEESSCRLAIRVQELHACNAQ